MQRYFQIYRIMLRNSLIREMNFAANFWLWMITEILWFGAQIGLVEVIFHHVDGIHHWSKWQVILLLGGHQIISQLFQALCIANMADLPELIRTGKLDFLLIQPVDFQFAVSLKRFGFDNLVNSLIGIGIVAVACWKLQYLPGFGDIILFFAAIVLGVIIHYSVMFILVTFSIWFVRASGMMHGYYTIFNIARYPDVIFSSAPKVVRVFFSIFVPVMVVSNVPARLLSDMTQGPSLVWAVIAMIMGTLWMAAFSRYFWHFALKSYTSASS